MDVAFLSWALHEFTALVFAWVIILLRKFWAHLPFDPPASTNGACVLINFSTTLYRKFVSLVFHHPLIATMKSHQVEQKEQIREWRPCNSRMNHKNKDSVTAHKFVLAANADGDWCWIEQSVPKTAMEYADRDRTRCSEGPHHVEKGTSHLIVVLQVQSLTRSIPWYMSIVSGKQHDRIGFMRSMARVLWWRWNSWHNCACRHLRSVELMGEFDVWVVWGVIY